LSVCTLGCKLFGYNQRQELGASVHMLLSVFFLGGGDNTSNVWSKFCMKCTTVW